jgi:hypothetical protein
VTGYSEEEGSLNSRQGQPRRADYGIGQTMEFEFHFKKNVDSPKVF